MKTVYKLSKRDLDRFKKPLLNTTIRKATPISGGYVYEGNLTPLKNKYSSVILSMGDYFTLTSIWR
jgi:hypothetical protein